MLSSISGRAGLPGISSYCASKFALEGWTESLRHELRPLGIHVVLVEPGSFETDIWTRNTAIAESSLSAASPNAARLARLQEHLGTAKKRSDPQIVADGIARILDAPRPRLRYVFGRDARLALVLRRLLPSRAYEWLVANAAGMKKP
jgi:NAD(P)-dependent dehydrogenase (short-subunit alcohol dehydrogenase family)